MTDLIERQAAIDAIEKALHKGTDPLTDTFIDGISDALNGLPSAQTEPLTVNFAREMDRETVEKLKEGLKNAPVLIMAVNDSAEPERKKPDHGYMWICPVCGLEVHSDFARCVRCGWDRPSAEPERKKGKWIMNENQRSEDVACGNYLYTCSKCGKSDIHAKTQEVPFCWWCGADMRGE